MKARVSMWAALLLVGSVLSGCAGGRDALTIYSGRDEALVRPLLERFSEETDTPIEVRYGDSADLALLIGEEGERSPADVFLSQSPGPVGFLAEKRRLGELDQRVLEPVEPRFRDDGRKWVGVTGRQRVLVYNRDMVDEDELPQSVFDLTHSKYAGKVAVAPPNASFQDFVTAMRALEGEQRTRSWLAGMAENGSPTYPDNNSIVAAVSRGEVEMGLANHYYNYRFLEEDPTLPSRNYVFPDGGVGALLITSSVSVIAGSDQKEKAERFVEFLLSAEAQRYFSQETFEYPLASGVRPAGQLPPLGSLDVPRLDLDRLGGDLEGTVKLIEESGLAR